MSKKPSTALTFDGCNFFRQRLVLSTLSGRAVRITGIRADDDEPGLREFEANFLRLVDAITNGTRIEVNETGTTVLYIPGVLIGGIVQHECNLQRSIGYYLEALVQLAPFCKKPLRATLTGVTNDEFDPSVDTIKYVTTALMKRFLIDDEHLDLKINKRGAMPDGGGEVFFTCPVARKLRPIQFTDPGKLKRIRGSAFCMKVAPAFANRLVDSSRGVLNKFLSDIYIYTDHAKGANSGNAPGFGLSLMVESTTGAMLSTDGCSKPKGCAESVVPEDLGATTSHHLLLEVFRGGCVDSRHQSLCLLFMALGQQDVSKVLLGALTPHTVQFMRHMREFFQVMYKIQPHRDPSEGDHEAQGSEEKYIVSCVGVGFTNLSKTSI